MKVAIVMIRSVPTPRDARPRPRSAETGRRGWRWLTGAVALAVGAAATSAADIECRLTDPRGTARFARVEPRAGTVPADVVTITIDRSARFQAIDGFGYTLTGGSAGHLMAMSPAARAALLRELFTTAGDGIGVSVLRLSIGASDLDASPFSYDDPPDGRPDPDLEHFSIAPDREALIPVLREILAIAPRLFIMASPWSPPAWMKTNNATIGGSLRPEYHGACADYFVRYLRAMRDEGIPVAAVTIQNEPLHPGNNPSLSMPAEQQAEFVKRFLGPALRAAGLDTRIIVYDHNCDRPDYPLAILADPEAKRWIDGSAFHLYGGSIDALSRVHDAHPDRHVYFTEQWVGAPGDLAADLVWHVRELTVGATRNWSRTVLEWNLSSNPRLEPHTPGGCDKCLGAVTIDGDRVDRNPAYYAIAHAARFVAPGSVRVGSDGGPGHLHHVAFVTPEGRVATIMVNDGPTALSVRITNVPGDRRGQVIPLPAGAVASCAWTPSPEGAGEP